ncbi:DUF3793 family protein [Clostridium neuense]|uniref:DUF3793 family protein n=1 Tax=Clostridium neuense TaxID=1728934 RepID=A0ABW8TH64_9CLOT
MSKEEAAEFFNIINRYDDFEYLLLVIISNCAPTLKKQKTASLINFTNNVRELNLLWEQYKDRVRRELKINFFELKKNKNSVVVLFYDDKLLKLSIKDKRNIRFLERFGYNDCMNVYECLCLLSKRYQNMCPHEIGVFLGYPIEDVIAFVDYPNIKCKLTGYWKVYYNEERAKVIFSTYDLIKQNVTELILKGYKPTELKFK